MLNLALHRKYFVLQNLKNTLCQGLCIAVSIINTKKQKFYFGRSVISCHENATFPLNLNYMKP